ncbi:restriction endonuclease subunit S [Salinisphaera sp. G21_0]|uniref:restriction endonuclease subunit S n=1 Tax=Salinisphaera sp. G21_0 TaxID=2821094 RepID=UPI001ADCFE94|nr:restriction endonuclease subunit S [Salinisphaera sp. G21_0]MBO9484309.1 restriction endonuclease subunit S [Salinisphaera sp. G21_0]
MNLSKKRLIELADYINGYAFKPAQLGKDGLPVIRIEQLKNPKAIDDHYDGVLPEHNIIDNGDLIFSWSASLFLDIWCHGKSALNQHLFKVVPKPGIDKHFLKYLIEYNLPKLTNAAHGSTMQHITRKELHAFFVEVPEDEVVQKKIARVITSINDLIRLYESKLAKQQRIKTGLMQDLLTKGIDEQGNIRSEATHEFKDSPLGRIPVEWDVTSIEKASLDVVDCPHTTPKFTNDGVLVARTFNIKNGRFQDTKASYVSESEYQTRTTRLEPQAGDIIFTREAPVGEAFVIPTGMKICLGQRVMLIRPNASEYIGEFLVTFIYSNAAKSIFDQICAGTTNPHLNVKEVRDFKFPKPPTKEQERILDAIKGINHQISSLEIKLSKSQRIKKGLMQDLLSGQKDISQLDLDKLISNLSV